MIHMAMGVNQSHWAQVFGSNKLLQRFTLGLGVTTGVEQHTFTGVVPQNVGILGEGIELESLELGHDLLFTRHSLGGGGRILCNEWAKIERFLKLLRGFWVLWNTEDADTSDTTEIYSNTEQTDTAGTTECYLWCSS
jgi:hypothetical protein